MALRSDAHPRSDRLLASGLAALALLLCVAGMVMYVHGHGGSVLGRTAGGQLWTGDVWTTGWLPAFSGVWILVAVWARSAWVWSGIAVLGVYGGYHLATLGWPFLLLSGILAWGASRLQAGDPGPTVSPASTASQSDK